MPLGGEFGERSPEVLVAELSRSSLLVRSGSLLPRLSHVRKTEASLGGPNVLTLFESDSRTQLLSPPHRSPERKKF